MIGLLLKAGDMSDENSGALVRNPDNPSSEARMK